MTTAHYHALDAQLAKAGDPRDPVSLDISDAEPAECSLCGGCGKVNYIEGDAVPARWVSDGGGVTVRDGERCPECHGRGVVGYTSEGDVIPGGTMVPVGDGAFERRGLGCLDCAEREGGAL